MIPSTSRSALVLASLALSATAQDSVSKHQALPGDALSAHQATEQIANYVVDQTVFRSSFGRVYGIAPIVKASENLDPSPIFFTHQIQAQGASNTAYRNVPFARTSYRRWTGQGFGINTDPAANDPGVLINTTGLMGSQFAAGFTEFGGSNTNVVTGIVNTVDFLPSRLFVSRVSAIQNSPQYFCSDGSVAFGGIDSDGNVHLRADDFGATPCGTQIVGNNYYRVDSLARGPLLNTLDGTGASHAAATTALLVASGTTHATPTIVPEQVAGRPILIGSNFASQYVFESGVGVLASSATHLPACASDHRGTVSYSHHDFPSLFPGSVNGTAGTIVLAASDGAADHLSVWGIAANGSVAPPALCASLPATLTDNEDGAMFGAGSLEFDHYHSQVPFQGGNGPVAIGRDQLGNLIVAAEVDHPADTGAQHEDNLIAVARVTPGGLVSWTVAGHNTAATGKAIYDAGGTQVGQMVSLSAVTGGVPPGPSVSAPMIDSVGNVYFLAAVEIFGGMGSDFDSALVRAVYDPAAFSYRLELVFDVGRVFQGVNSATPYQVRFMSLADSNSVSSATAWSGNMVQEAFNGLDPSTLESDSSLTLGGLVLGAQIVYDVDGDGMFIPSTGQNGVPGSPDEDYNVLLLVTGQSDCDDNGVPDDLDIFEGTLTDANGNGEPDECEFGPGTPYCFGDGSGSACPCGNTGGPGEGCLNSGGAGMTIRATGTTSIASDDLTMIAEQCPPNHAGIFYCGTVALAGSPLYSGLQCAAGNVRRFQGVFQTTGTATDTGFVAQEPTGTYFVAGTTYHFQFWSRDLASPCIGQPVTPSAVANFSPGYAVVMTP